MRRIAVVLLGWASLSAALAAPDPAPRDVVVDWAVAIPMRDGTRLNANIYRPAQADGGLPVVLTVTPYTADTLHGVAMWFARHGYVYAAVDTRGRGGSSGAFLPTLHEAQDGYDVIQWLATMPGSDGRVVGWGGSYAGRNQLAFATLAPPALKAIAPASAGMTTVDRDMRANIPFPQLMQWLVYTSGPTSNRAAYTDRAYWLGALAELASGRVPYRDFDRMVGLPSPLWQNNLRHPTIDAYWRETVTDAGILDAAQLKRVSIPLLAITGAYDPSQTGLRAYLDARALAVSPAVIDRQYLVLGPWDHPGTRNPQRVTGGVDMGAASVINMLELHRQWFDWILNRGPKPAFLADHFAYFLAGADRWETAPSLASASAPLRKLMLSSPVSNAGAVTRAGALTARAPGQADDRYVYDPSVPGRNEGVEGFDLVAPNWLTDATAVTRLNGEGLVYDGLPLDAPTDLVGIPAADLYLTMDVPDTDIRVALYAVMPDGTQIFLTQDQARARYRTSLTRETPVVIGKRLPYAFHRFDFVARRLPQGARLRLVVSPLGLSIHQQRNRNSGKPVADEVAADNRIAHVALAMGPGLSRLDVPLRPAR
ncbi:CocE/NonD family hydrolase [Sphingobium sp. AP50]|uniref:CocE/NonD family hydrolase n=1 Tax=Sphingobium sp. AP50 TaxID=1884369 RepID=UPI0015A4F08C|nr:CocE/NonD family hydrolase [Sphingobium sp. AP50]